MLDVGKYLFHKFYYKNQNSIVNFYIQCLLYQLWSKVVKNYNVTFIFKVDFSDTNAESSIINYKSNSVMIGYIHIQAFSQLL